MAKKKKTAKKAKKTRKKTRRFKSGNMMVDFNYWNTFRTKKEADYEAEMLRGTKKRATKDGIQVRMIPATKKEKEKGYKYRLYFNEDIGFYRQNPQYKRPKNLPK